MFLLIYVLDSVSFVMFVCLSLYSLLPDIWWIKLFKELLKRRSVTSDMRRFRKTLDYVLIRDRVKFKVACLVRQSLFGQAPLYLVTWLSHLRGAANTRQLRRQNFCSRWTSLVELSSSQSRHHLRTVQTTAEKTPFSGSMNAALCDCW